MSLALPLSVRLQTARTDRNVTRELRDLTFSSSAPGGYRSATVTLTRPLDRQPDEVQYFGKLYIYDSRSGATVWEGMVEDPGRAAGDQGSTFSVTAIGPASHTRDDAGPLIYVDSSTERWWASRYNFNVCNVQRTEIDDGTPSMTLKASEGGAISNAFNGDITYRAIYYAGQKIGRLRCQHHEGATTAAYQFQIVCRTGDSGVNLGTKIQDFDTTGGIHFFQYGDPEYIDGQDIASFRIARNGASTTAGSGLWSEVWDMVIRSMLMDETGTDILSGYTVNTVTVEEVVRDLLGRRLTRYDGPGATINTSGYAIDQCAYPDGATAEQILDDLMTLDPAFYWAAWESNADGLHRFEWRAWPTDVRYEASTEDGFDSPGSATDIFNSVRVRWVDPKGRIKFTRRTNFVLALDDAGIDREHYIDLADEIGSSANAAQVGDNFLAEHEHPPNAGTLTIRRPILDHDTGRMVMPWEIVPGHLIRVRGVQPRVDALNPTDRDGVTVFRVVSTDFSASDGAVTLELDSYARTVTRALAKLAARRNRKR